MKGMMRYICASCMLCPDEIIFLVGRDGKRITKKHTVVAAKIRSIFITKQQHKTGKAGSLSVEARLHS